MQPTIQWREKSWKDLECYPNYIQLRKNQE